MENNIVRGFNDMQTVSEKNRALINEYLDIAENASENLDRFVVLLSDDCIWSLMPPGISLNGIDNVRKFVKMAMKSRKHDNRTKIKIQDWFAVGEKFCVEYYHAAYVVGIRVKENVCLICHMKDGQFDRVNEYVDTSGSGLIKLGLWLMPIISKVKGIHYNRTCV